MKTTLGEANSRLQTHLSMKPSTTLTAGGKHLYPQGIFLVLSDLTWMASAVLGARIFILRMFGSVTVRPESGGTPELCEVTVIMSGAPCRYYCRLADLLRLTFGVSDDTVDVLQASLDPEPNPVC